MVKNGYGHIVSTASAASYLAPPYAVDYAVAKVSSHFLLVLMSLSLS